MPIELVQESPWRWRIEPARDMRVPGIVFATHELLPDLVGTATLAQVRTEASKDHVSGSGRAR